MIIGIELSLSCSQQLPGASGSFQELPGSFQEEKCNFRAPGSFGSFQKLPGSFQDLPGIFQLRGSFQA